MSCRPNLRPHWPTGLRQIVCPMKLQQYICVCLHFAAFPCGSLTLISTRTSSSANYDTEPSTSMLPHIHRCAVYLHVHVFTCERWRLILQGASQFMPNAILEHDPTSLQAHCGLQDALELNSMAPPLKLLLVKLWGTCCVVCERMSSSFTFACICRGMMG